MRAFLAAAFRPSLEPLAHAASDALKGRVGGGFRWVPPEQVHLTLRFLGKIPDARVADHSRAVKAAVASLSVFSLRTAGLGAFPGPEKARILWLGLEDPEKKLHTLLLRIEEALKPLALPWEERPFVPHLTLARHRTAGTDVRGAFASALSPPFSVHWLEGVALFRSDLRSSGPAHTCLSLAPLAGAG